VTWLPKADKCQNVHLLSRSLQPEIKDWLWN